MVFEVLDPDASVTVNAGEYIPFVVGVPTSGQSSLEPPRPSVCEHVVNASPAGRFVAVKLRVSEIVLSVATTEAE